jgi:hypothetical protein
LKTATGPAQQVGSRGMQGVESVEFHGDIVNQAQAGLRTFGHGDRNRLHPAPPA